MAFRWEEYFELAKKINETFKGEAARRTVISRAYYSMFCLARDCIGYKNAVKIKGWEDSVHKKVIRELKRKNYDDFKKAGRKLDSLRQLRIVSDYDTDTEITKKDVEFAISLAKEIYNLLVHVCPNLTRERSNP